MSTPFGSRGQDVARSEAVGQALDLRRGSSRTVEAAVSLRRVVDVVSFRVDLGCGLVAVAACAPGLATRKVPSPNERLDHSRR